MSRYLFSVVTPFHNVDMGMFENAARHMEQQTIGFENIEWVVVCHNCDEEHIRAVKERLGAYENVVIEVIANNIHTPSSPRNHGLRFATADYVGFLDGDDNFRLDTIEKILEKFQSTKAQMVVFRRGYTAQHPGMTAISETVAWNQTYEEIIVTKEGFQDNKLYNDFPFFITSRAYDRKFLAEHDITFDDEITIAEDCYFNLEVMRYADRICYCPQLIGYNYYVNDSSMLNSSKSDEEISTMIDSAVKIIERAYDYGVYPNVIIKVVCFVLCRFAMDPAVSQEIKFKMKENLEEYLYTTVPIPDGRFTEPFNTYLNTLPQQVFASISNKDAKKYMEDDASVLAGILSQNRETDYGRRYAFRDIFSMKGYQVQVPVSDYSTYAPLIDLQISIGEKKILTDTPAKWYIKNYEGRYFPVSEAQYAESVRAFSNTLRGKHVFFWYEDVNTSEVFNDGVAANNGMKMSLSGYFDGYRYGRDDEMVEFTSPECIYFCGDQKTEDIEYVNMLLAVADRDVDQLLCFQASEVAILFKFMSENADRLCRDLAVGEISEEIALSIHQRKMIRSYLRPDPERAEEIRSILAEGNMDGIGNRIWPGIRYITCIATGGQSVFRKKLNEYFKDVIHSNGMMTTFAGVFGEAVGETDHYKLARGTVFYEFMPVDGEKGRPLFCSETDEGKVYILIVTTPSGLYRYNTGITIKIVRKDDENIFFTVE